MLKLTPYQMGWFAYRLDELCPFMYGTEEYEEWHDGFDDAREEDFG